MKERQEIRCMYCGRAIRISQVTRKHPLRVPDHWDYHEDRQCRGNRTGGKLVRKEAT